MADLPEAQKGPIEGNYAHARSIDFRYALGNLGEDRRSEQRRPIRR